jgi:transcription termination/antitermination protein NusG
MDLPEPEEQFQPEPQETGTEHAEEPQAPRADFARDEAPAQEPAADQPIPVEAQEEEPAAEAEMVPAPSSRPKTGGSIMEGQLPPEASSEPAWYVIHCYSGYENKVRHNLEQRIETMGMKDRIFDVVIPTQEEIEVRDGKRRTVERHIFPGYVLVNMSLSEESWYVVRNTPGVTGFVGMGNLPTPLRPEEVSQIIKRMEAEAPTVKVTFKVGERVRIIDGPFNDFRGTVAEIDMERTKVRVMVSFFGRETPVELDFLQVEKA